MTETTSTPPDWHRGADGKKYPPEPWYLGGTLLVSTFLVPRRQLPSHMLAAASEAGVTPVSVGSRIVASAVFVRYTSGGVLTYDELIGGLLVRRGVSPMVTIPNIWVDSAQSRIGGRELWSIPKHLADFDWVERGGRIAASMSSDGAPVAALDARIGRRLLPGTPPVPLTTAQHLDGRTVVSHNYIYPTVRSLSAEWTFAADGPMGYLQGRRPTLSVALADASIVFGVDVARSGVGSVVRT